MFRHKVNKLQQTETLFWNAYFIVVVRELFNISFSIRSIRISQVADWCHSTITRMDTQNVVSLANGNCTVARSRWIIGTAVGMAGVDLKIHSVSVQVRPSVLWRCWLGGRKGIRPVKNWVLGCWHGYLSGARCRLAYGPADATATHWLLLQQNPDWF